MLDEIIQDAEREDEEEKESTAAHNLTSAASTQYNKSKGAFNV